ncbi:MAG: elongation factor P [Bdellovibrionales bacterium]|nr:elongation factor P [Bdellovibrionales bacterium]
MKAKDIRKGAILMYKDAPHRVMNFEHRTPGNLRAFVQVTMRNLKSGAQSDTRFSSTEDIPEADVFSYKATFTYADGETYYFMNTTSYEQVPISLELLGDGRFYLQDGMEVDILEFNGNPIGITLPKTVVLTVAETEPELKGATASNSPKPATTETGLTVSVPPFIKVGERIIVDTEEARYVSRAES